MADLITLLDPDPPNPVPAVGYCLWFRPDRSPRSAAWQLVASAATEAGAVACIGTGGRRGGRWLVLPAGREP